MTAVAARRVEDLDWRTWRATDRATLVFCVDGGRILLIRKKRGLGAGKVNGPGGRLEGDETPRQCAVRECQEELHVEPLNPKEFGRLRFQFVDGYGLDVHVFRADEFLGQARETDEAIPLWTAFGDIPYDEMWQDDRLWIPFLLAERTFDGYFIFDGDSMLDHTLEADVDLSEVPGPRADATR
ncbi:MAG: 8-oxo-dGTP diphosphatase [Acidobacteriota bacterium]